MDKIANNPSYKKLQEDIQGLKLALKASQFLGIQDEEARRRLKDAELELENMESSLKELVGKSDKFNQYFSSHGWIAHESMEHSVIEKAVLEYESAGYKQAEQILLNYFAAENIKKRLFLLNSIPPFWERKDLIKIALNDYAERRYFSCVPLMLMLIDGIVNDVNKRGGIAAESTDLEVWDSLAGHNSGLNVIKQMITATRKKTTTEKINLPYRNGILHGRDLNYGNHELAAKCWGILFSISDWSRAYLSEEKRKEEYLKKTQKQEKPFLESMLQFKKHQNKMRDVNVKIDKWTPRNLEIGTDIPETGESTKYGVGTPERAVVEFIELINKKNYGYLYDKMYKGYTGVGSRQSQITEIRNDFSAINIKTYKLNKIDDAAPAISEIYTSLQIIKGEQQIITDIKFRLVFRNEDDFAPIFGFDEGEWKIVKGYMDVVYAR